MMDAGRESGWRHAWCTVALPESTPLQAIRALADTGYEGIEWRVTSDSGDTLTPGYWTGNRCTLQENWPNHRFREIARWTAEEGLLVPNLGSYVQARKPEAVKRIIEIAALLNAPSFRVAVSDYDRTMRYHDLFSRDRDDFARAVSVCSSHGVKALVEIHMGTILPSASAAHRFVSQFSPDLVGVIFDPGNMVYEGFEDYQLGLELLGDYIVHVHAKNARPICVGDSGGGQSAWGVEFAPLWEGAADFTKVMLALRATGYGGWISCEDFSNGADEREKLVSSLRYLRQVEDRAHGVNPGSTR